jgi:AcrR family transcriptional regulator
VETNDGSSVEALAERAESASGRRTREGIVEKAVELFAAKGYAGTSLNDIAAVVGIRKPSLYHYIKTEEDLLYEIDSSSSPR